MAWEPDLRPTGLSRELIALIKAVGITEERRDARLEAKLAELDARMEEATRVQELITGGTARREARLRALEDMVEAMAAERARALTQRPLDLPRRTRFDPSVVDIRSPDPEPNGSA